MNTSLDLSVYLLVMALALGFMGLGVSGWLSGCWDSYCYGLSGGLCVTAGIISVSRYRR
jgi:hypothetical protein